ncbi:MAG: ABC transporter ATP-binding protein [Desulfobacteraceae bacterium 4572_123]|nr:MAG: ABC transporter ATP-binding protein [Desulfobacteraceae bacterium 4572_123]
MAPALEVRDLVKHYPGVMAVDGISFAIPQGICFGLIGPNGAGKTTTIEIIEGIIPHYSGKVLYNGSSKTSSFQEEVGIQFQATSLFSFLTVQESLETFHNLYREPMPLGKVIRLCRLEDILSRRNNKLSGGQKQRLMLAIALVNDPNLLFLDEPTTGLDPQARRHLWEIVETIKAQGKTVVLTTHYMEEAQILCEEIAIIDQGRIIAQGSPDDLVRNHCSGVILSFPKNGCAISHKLFSEKIRLICPDMKIIDAPNRYEIMITEVNLCIEALLRDGIDLSLITIRPQTLEDLFLKLTGRQLRQ